MDARDKGYGGGMRKSCLAQLVILVVIVAVLSLALSRTVRRALETGQVAESGPTTTSPVQQPTLPIGGAQASGAGGSAPGTVEPSPFVLVSSRPVMLDDCLPAGLALTARDLYLACERTDGQGGYVARASRDDYAVVARQQVASAGADLGGMADGPDGVWLALRHAAAPGRTDLLQLAPDTLTTISTVTVPAAVVSVAVAGDGAIYTSSCTPSMLVRWSAGGALSATAETPDDACYTDIELLRGKLVGVAVVHGEGVLDVIDPQSLTLLARHTIEIVSARGNPLAANALATDGDVLVFAPDPQTPPTIMTYRPREGGLADFVPEPQP